MKIKAIMALNNFGFLGKDGKLMWHSSEDFKHFKQTTMNSVCIVGSKTFEQDLKGKGLPGREMVVVGKEYINSLSEALNKAFCLASNVKFNEIEKGATNSSYELIQKKDIFVIGGLSIYKALENIIDEWHISIINDSQIGDVHFELTNKIKDKATFYKFEKK